MAAPTCPEGLLGGSSTGLQSALVSRDASISGLETFLCSLGWPELWSALCFVFTVLAHRQERPLWSPECWVVATAPGHHGLGPC